MSDASRVLAALEQRLGAISDGPRPLEGGITNRNFVVRFADRRCVLRLPGKDTGLLGISRAAEREANVKAAELGLAPAVVFSDERCLITDYVDGTPCDTSRARGCVVAVARALRAFHDSGLELPVRFWVPDLLDDYVEIVRSRVARLPERLESARAIARRIGEAVPLRLPVACHNDLLPANVLAAGERIMLVDWEYAGMGHRLFDLGNFAVNCELDDEAELELLRAYCDGEPAPDLVAGLRLMRAMSDAREAAWGAVQAVVSNLDFDFPAYAERHFDRLEATAASPDFVRWLKAAARHA